MEAQANKTKGIRCLEHTLLGQSTRRHMLDLYLCETSANFTIMDCALNRRTLTCYECGSLGHYKSDCPELKSQNHGNQAEGIEARGMGYALGGGETDRYPNNLEDEIEA
ncbi:retrovirus-related pol polyprotein from transposon TNT 1-94 [Tanacetum coccineum]